MLCGLRSAHCRSAMGSDAPQPFIQTWLCLSVILPPCLVAGRPAKFQPFEGAQHLLTHNLMAALHYARLDRQLIPVLRMHLQQAQGKPTLGQIL